MSTDHLTPHAPTTDAQRKHRRQLLRLLAARDRLVTAMRAGQVSEEDELESLQVLTMVEEELEFHFPGVFANHLPEWLAREAEPDTAAESECGLCRGSWPAGAVLLG